MSRHNGAGSDMQGAGGDLDLVRVPVAALRHRHAAVRRRDRSDGPDVRRPTRRPRSSTARPCDRAPRQPLRDGGLGCNARGPADDDRDEQEADPQDHRDPVHRCPDLRPLPDLRRPATEPAHLRPGDAPGSPAGDSQVRHAGGSAAVRRVHAQLAAGTALPRRRPLHHHAPGPRRLGARQRTGTADVPPLARLREGRGPPPRPSFIRLTRESCSWARP